MKWIRKYTLTHFFVLIIQTINEKGNVLYTDHFRLPLDTVYFVDSSTNCREDDLFLKIMQLI